MRFAINPDIDDAARRWNPFTGAHGVPWRLPARLPSPPFEGGAFPPATSKINKPWLRGVPAGAVRAVPCEIRRAFLSGRYLWALELVIAWGGMARTIHKIYAIPARGGVCRSCNKRYDIQAEIRAMAVEMRASQSLSAAWERCCHQLEWSPVLASKFLHFLCAALFPDDPDIPVPYDNCVTRKCLNADFLAHTKRALFCTSTGIRTYADYANYMTAMIRWRQALPWARTTADVETSLFAGYHCRR